MTGNVVAIRNHGTIVELILDTGAPIYFDHRPFGHLYEAEQGNIVGRHVTVEVDGDGEQTVSFEEAHRG